jgi:DNA-binding transcriptional LysR family regulator
MDTLRAMRVYVRIVELGSLSAAARELGTTQPTVSKLLAQLEAELGVRLLERSTRGPVPTEQGLRFHLHAKGLLEEYEAAVGAARGATARAEGQLRINAPVALGQFKVNAIVQDFLRAHPGIEVELILNDRFVDLVEEGVDLALRLGGPLPPSVIARHIGTARRFLVAAPDYLARHGAPSHPEELTRHAFVRFAWTSGAGLELSDASLTLAIDVASRYRVNNAFAIVEALAMGSGIGLCPEWMVHEQLESGELVRVLPAWTGSAQLMHLLYPSRRYQPLRTRLFIEFASARLAAMPGLDPPG